MFKVISWNVRGAGGKKFKSAIYDLNQLHKMDILIVCEPKVQFSKTKNFLRKIGFPDAEVVEASGFSGGIWILYDKKNTAVTFVDSNTQSVTIKISGVGSQDWILTAVYANPNSAVTRNVLWEYFNYFAITTTLPWVVIGDFNELVSSSDKKGGSLTGNFGGLRQWVQDRAMVDLWLSWCRLHLDKQKSSGKTR